MTDFSSRRSARATRLATLLRLALGGALGGALVGSFGGALLGVAFGAVRGDLSLGLDGAVGGSLLSACAGAVYGSALGLRTEVDPTEFGLGPGGPLSRVGSAPCRSDLRAVPPASPQAARASGQGVPARTDLSRPTPS